MKMKIFTFFEVSLMLLGSIAVFGQQELPPIDNNKVQNATTPALTPNITGSNVSIGNIFSPNLYDGSVNINVPIYQYNTDYGSYGVSLGYNTKGVKVDEMASSVGLHWTLNAGGSIYRSLKDVPDELNTAWASPEYNVLGVQGKIAQDISPGGFTGYLDNEYDDFVVAAGSLSFTFNMGKDGFIFTHPHRNVRIQLLIDDLPVTAIPMTDPESVLNIGFHITDEQGNQYWFGKGDVQLYNRLSANPEDELTDQYISRWVLNKVRFANGSEIVYHYIIQGPSYNTLYKSFVTMEQGGLPHTAVFGVTATNVDITPQNTVQLSEISSIDYPNNIQVSFVYSANAASRCDKPDVPNIEEIKIQPAGSGNCIRYKLNQAYSIAPNDTSSLSEIAYGGSCLEIFPSYTHKNQLYHRLILKSVSILSCDGTLEEPYYSFEYDPLRLPKRLSGSQDYFGYYNGQTVTEQDGTFTIPYHTNVLYDNPGNPDVYGVNRSVHPAYIHAGLLTKVKNAYGGSVAFDYEGHNLATMLTNLPNDANFIGVNANDGLRVSKITEKDKFYPGNNKQTFYTYEGGQRFLTGGFYFFPRSVHQDGSIGQYYYTGIPVSPLQLINGSNHGYSKVTATVKDQSGNLLGKTEICYTNFSDSSSGNQNRYTLVGGQKEYFQYPFADRQYIRDWEMGLPIQTTTYDRNGHIVSFVKNTYSFSIDSTSTINKVENKKMMRSDHWVPDPLDSNYSVIAHNYPLDSVSYRPYTGWAEVIKTETRKYISDNVYVQDTVTYQYDDRHNLEYTIATNSKGEQTMLRQIYNYNVSGPDVSGGDQTGTTLYNMTAAGLEKVVSLERWKLPANPQLFNNKLIDASITRFSYNSSMGILLTKGLYTLAAGSPISFQSYTSELPGNIYGKVLDAYNGTQPPGHFKELSEVTLFDAKGNPRETKLLGMDQYKAMIWDPATGNKIAEAVNAKNNEIGYADFEIPDGIGHFYYNVTDAVENTAIPGGTYISGKKALKCTSTDSLPIHQSGLTHDKEYMVAFWCKGGTPKFMSDGNPVTLTLAHIKGDWRYYQGKFTTTTGTVGLTTTGTPSSPFIYYIDEMRIFPADAQMQTWVYEPLFGVSSASDARGRITYYAYDKLGRLTVVSDQEGNILSQSTYTISN